MSVKFKYLGKKKNFKLDKKVYKFATPLNPGDEFELSGNDLVLMKRCIKIAILQGTPKDKMDIVVSAQHEYDSVKEDGLETDETPKTEEPPKDAEIEEEEVVPLVSKKVAELLGICKEKGITVPAGTSKSGIVALIEAK